MSRRPQRSPARRRPSAAARLELGIDSLGARGDGVATHDGQPVFVPGALPGERVVATLEGRRGDGLAAHLVEILEPSPARQAPPCPQFGQCGGCLLQHLDQAAYLAWKRHLLCEALGRIGISEDRIAPLVAVAPGSRRRAAFAFKTLQRQALLGFNARASHQIVDIADCLLLDPAITALLPALRQLFASLLPTGIAGDVTVTATESGLDLLIEAEVDLDLAARERLAAFAAETDLARLSWRRQGFVEPLAHRRPAVVRFGPVMVTIPPGGFLQPSREGEAALTRLVLAAVGEAGPVADLYAGSGSFTFPLAETRAVHAVEGEASALAALKAAADAAGARVGAECRDLAQRPLLAGELKRFAAVVFDPPRAGAPAQAEQLALAGPPLVVAVSCNPATLARDARILMGGGYRLSEATPVDQFPYTAHLETVAVFRRE